MDVYLGVKEVEEYIKTMRIYCRRLEEDIKTAANDYECLSALITERNVYNKIIEDMVDKVNRCKKRNRNKK